MTDAQIYDAVTAELASARSRYPWWPADIIHACAIANEESGEVVKAVNNYHWKHGDDTIDDIRKEAVQAIAMWCRFLVDSPGMHPDEHGVVEHVAVDERAYQAYVNAAWREGKEAVPYGEWVEARVSA